MKVAAIVLVASALAAGAGCAGRTERAAQPRERPSAQGAAPSTSPSPRPAPSPKPAPKPKPSCTPGVRRARGEGRVAYAALVRRPTRAFHAPGRRPSASFGLRNVNGHVTVFGVLGVVLARDCRPTWYRVQLPLRPNGATGFVRARDVQVEAVRTRIVVDLSERRLILFRGGRKVLEARAAVGAPETPTPTGRFYVNQRLIPDDPGGPWGPGAVGISAFSEVLRNWTQGGPIAIHGTNAPWSIGLAASHGCIRLANAVLERLFRATPAGTPVVIRS